MEKEEGYREIGTIRWRPPSWESIGQILMSELKKGSIAFALGVVPDMINKLVAMEKYADDDGKVHVCCGGHHSGFL